MRVFCMVSIGGIGDGSGRLCATCTQYIGMVSIGSEAEIGYDIDCTF